MSGSISSFIALGRLAFRQTRLRVSDVERQPFRSMGFVSVIIVSGQFALGLPVVLL